MADFAVTYTDLHGQIRAIVITPMWQKRQILDYFAALAVKYLTVRSQNSHAISQFCQRRVDSVYETPRDRVGGNADRKRQRHTVM